MLTQCEYATDAYLLDHGTDAKAYARALCDVAEGPSPGLALPMAGHAPLRERVSRLVKPTGKSGTAAMACLVFLTIGSGLGMSLVRLAPQALPERPGTPVDTSEAGGYSAEEIEWRFDRQPFSGGLIFTDGLGSKLLGRSSMPVITCQA